MKYTNKYEYEYEDVDCKYCAQLIEYSQCPHSLCPYILNNLSELKTDDAFLEAVENAHCCTSYHRPTLLWLQKWWFPCPV